MLDTKLTQRQDLEIVVRPVDGDGKPAPVEAGSLTLTTSDDGVIAPGEFVAVEGDEGAFKSLAVVSGVGSATLTLTADADLGEGREEISEMIAVVVEHTKATSLGVTLTPVPKAS